MTATINLVGISTDGAVIGSTDDGWNLRINPPAAPDELPLTSLIGPGFSETWRAGTMQLGLSRARDIIARRRRMVGAGVCQDECALADASRRNAA